ncbi:carboxypeptidase-like regulatory domain-containing protein [Lysobacter sp. HA18]
MNTARIAVAAALLTMCAVGTASAQRIYSRSRHDTVEHRDGLFDTAEAERLLEPGTGSLSGVLMLASKPGLLARKQVVYADRELVTLFPMTTYLKSWLDKYQTDMVIGMTFMSDDAARYTARVITDKNGRFEIRGLQPGRYLLHASVPYSVDGVRREETGKRQYNIDYWNGTATSSPIYNETAIKMDLEHYVNMVVDVQAGKPTVLDAIK